MKILADLEVATKAVGRTAGRTGDDVVRGERLEIQRAVQLDLPIVIGPPVPILYLQMDGTGAPVVKKETEWRKGKAEGQTAHPREAKLGCVFTQTAWDEEGFAIRDPDSTTCAGAIEAAEAFGKRLYVQAWKRGWSRAQKKVVMGGGAEWIWNLAGQHFPGAVQIVDLNRARQRLWEYIPLTERFRLQYRVEAFNALNRPSFAAAPVAQTNANFGRINDQANLPRAVQMALRLRS